MKPSFSDTQDTIPPVIPDHDMIRLIGKGSYGQVWLARGVTGALRAVKVVRRSDFEYDRTFEREFEGIKNYEPISRGHAGLVAILHVGRNLTAGFYYYVMELADDRLTGKEIIPELYVPHTLSTDTKKQGRLEIDECLRVGVILADALHHMHSQGLSHRDVKPSNVIFVNGHPELADIGLVAASGQRTFVGTEGFVPPEGPGSPQADIYSLGMVLYEISTGKDRMDFPEVPGDFATDSERKKWRQLNSVVCKACAPSPKQRYDSAREMRLALDRVRRSPEPPATVGVKVLRLVLFSGLLAMSITFGRNADFFHSFNETKQLIDKDASDHKLKLAIAANGGTLPAHLATNGKPEDTIPPVDPPIPETPKTGIVQIVSDSPGARVFAKRRDAKDWEDWGLAQPVVTRTDLKPGPMEFRLELEGYEAQTFSADVVEGSVPQLVEAPALNYYNPPKKDQDWANSLGMTLAAREDEHRALRAVAPAEFRRFLEATGEEFSLGEGSVTSTDPAIDTTHLVAFVNEDAVKAFCEWMTETERAAGYLDEMQYYAADSAVPYQPEGSIFDASGNAGVAIFLAVRRELRGSVTVGTTPDGASLYIGEEYRGTTPVTVGDVKPGRQNITVQLDGFTRKEASVDVKPGETTVLDLKLEPSNAVVFGKPWANHLGMEFVPMGPIMVSVWETRVIDYAAFLAATGKAHAVPGFSQDEKHPVVSVSWQNARKFCEWLTEDERAHERIGPDDRYRLPTDREWSQAAGLAEEPGANPAARAAAMWEDKRYPWGTEWPPPPGSGNFADASAAVVRGPEKVITGYDDRMPYTAPVGSFAPNALGLHDLAGNVTEFVDDLYGGESAIKDWSLTRGGDYETSSAENLRSAARRPVVSDRMLPHCGFRVVLVRGEGDE